MTRRSKRKKNVISDLTIYFDNINGFASKKDSLEQIVKIQEPDIIGLCETKQAKLNKCSISGYEGVVSNLKQGKEGFLVAAREGTFKSIELLSEINNQIVTVQIVYPNTTVRIILVHGPQEDDKLEERKVFYEELAVEVERCRSAGEIPIVLGDLNAKIEERKNEVCAYSQNGKLLKELIDESELKVVNFHKKTVGKWTRIQTTKRGTVKSVLDYVLLDEEMFNQVSSLIIDEERLSTPYRIVKKKGRSEMVFTDHTAMILKIECQKGKVEKKVCKKKIWNLSKEGYVKFENATKNQVPVRRASTMTFMYAEWLKYMQKTLHECFGKKTVKPCKEDPNLVKLNRRRKRIREILQRIAMKGKIQRIVVRDYIKMLYAKQVSALTKNRAERLKKTADELTVDERFSPNGYWKIKKSISRKKNEKVSCIVTEGKAEVFGETQMRNEYQNEFQQRLRNRAPDPNWEGYARNINKLLELMLEQCDGEESLNFTVKELIKAISKLKNGKVPGDDELPAELFKCAGKGMLESLLFVFNEIKRTKEIPNQWNSVQITTIYKNKGSKKELVNYRGIFLTIVVAKIFENILKERMKDELMTVNLHQAGSRPNRSAADNLFLLRGCIDHQKYKGKPIYITAYDFQQAFDSLWLQDCIIAVSRLGVKNDLLKLLYNLNKEATITVKTPYGMTESFTVEDIVEQGTVLGPVLCSVSTGEYCGINKGVSVGTAQISSLLFVDDVIDMSTNCPDAEECHENAVVFSKKKKLPFAQTKCKSMVVNKRKNDQTPNLYIENHKVKDVGTIVYLGDVFNIKGNNTDLIEDRVRRGTSALIQIEALIKETGLGIFTISVHLLLYSSLFLSSIVFNSESWSNLKEGDLSKLRCLQMKFLKKMVKAPQSTSNAFTCLEFGVLPVEYEIHKRQLNFLHHILLLREDDPVKLLFENMKKFLEEENWWTNVNSLLVTYSLKLEDVKDVTRPVWKRKVSEAVQKVAFRSLLEDCNSKSKTRDLKYSKLERQEYLACLYPQQSSRIFQCRSKTLDIKEYRSYKYNDKICRVCNQDEESLSHVVNCGYSEHLDTSVIDNLGEIGENLKVQLIGITMRIESFLERVED